MNTTYISEHIISFNAGDTEGSVPAEIGGATIVGLSYAAGHSGTITLKDAEREVTVRDIYGDAVAITIAAAGGTVPLLKEDLTAIQVIQAVLSVAAPSGGFEVKILARQLM